MAKYIDKAALLKYASRQSGLRVDARDIERFPAADVEKVRHGRYLGVSDKNSEIAPVYGLWFCSACRCCFEEWNEKPTYRYCPCCGAKMDGGEER